MKNLLFIIAATLLIAVSAHNGHKCHHDKHQEIAAQEFFAEFKETDDEILNLSTDLERY